MQHEHPRQSSPTRNVTVDEAVDGWANVSFATPVTRAEVDGALDSLFASGRRSSLVQPSPPPSLGGGPLIEEVDEVSSITSDGSEVREGAGECWRDGGQLQ